MVVYIEVASNRMRSNGTPSCYLTGVLTPPLELAARRRLDFDLALTNFVPVGAERRPTRLGVRFEHGPSSVFVRVAIYLRKQCVSFCSDTHKGQREKTASMRVIKPI
jgi:hypothetical protein